MKAFIFLFGCILFCSSCARQSIGASFRYKGAVVTRCAECISGENGFFVSFKKPVNGVRPESIKTNKGISKFSQYDRYTLYVSISRAYSERRVLKKIVKFVKKGQ